MNLIRLSALTRLRAIYQIMIVLNTSTDITEEINKHGIVVFTLNDSIRDALKDCDDITASLVMYRRDLKSEKITNQCDNVIRILKTMKQKLLLIMDILSTNSKLKTDNSDYDLSNDLVFSIDKLLRYMKEEAHAYDE